VGKNGKNMNRIYQQGDCREFPTAKPMETLDAGEAPLAAPRTFSGRGISEIQLIPMSTIHRSYEF